MTLCAQVGEGPLLPKWPKVTLKQFLRVPGLAPGHFQGTSGCSPGSAAGDGCPRCDPGWVRWPQLEHHSPSFLPSSKCWGWGGSQEGMHEGGSQGMDEKPLGRTRAPRRS